MLGTNVVLWVLAEAINSMATALACHYYFSFLLVFVVVVIVCLFVLTFSSLLPLFPGEQDWLFLSIVTTYNIQTVCVG